MLDSGTFHPSVMQLPLTPPKSSFCQFLEDWKQGAHSCSRYEIGGRLMHDPHLEVQLVYDGIRLTLQRCTCLGGRCWGYLELWQSNSRGNIPCLDASDLTSDSCSPHFCDTFNLASKGVSLRLGRCQLHLNLLQLLLQCDVLMHLRQPIKS